MPALPLDDAGPYVAAAYLVFLALILVYVALVAMALVYAALFAAELTSKRDAALLRKARRAAEAAAA